MLALKNKKKERESGYMTVKESAVVSAIDKKLREAEQRIYEARKIYEYQYGKTHTSDKPLILGGKISARNPDGYIKQPEPCGT
ncbi:MAG: hypothetical protein ACE5HX_10170 [bacterium]